MTWKGNQVNWNRRNHETIPPRVSFDEHWPARLELCMFDSTKTKIFLLALNFFLTVVFGSVLADDNGESIHSRGRKTYALSVCPGTVTSWCVQSAVNTFVTRVQTSLKTGKTFHVLNTLRSLSWSGSLQFVIHFDAVPFTFYHLKHFYQVASGPMNNC